MKRCMFCEPIRQTVVDCAQVFIQVSGLELDAGIPFSCPEPAGAFPALRAEHTLTLE